MDILYILGEGYSRCDNNELRYSLRGIEKYGKNVDNVYVAGYCPEWLSDKVHKVPMESQYLHSSNLIEKHINMFEAILYTIDNTNIGDDFLVSMDDHFYIREVDFDNYPIYAKIVGGNTQLAVSKKPPTKYGRFVLKTKEFLQSLGLPTYYFTLHRNMHVFKETVNQCRDIIATIKEKKIECEPFIFLLNYRYNKEPFEFTPIKDIKIKEVSSWNRVDPNVTEVFSTYNFETDSELDLKIKGLYPDKSKYEL